MGLEPLGLCSMEKKHLQSKFMDEIEVPIVVEDEELLPFYGSAYAAGADVRAAISEDVVMQPGEFRLIPTGMRLAIPEGFEIQVRPRSGLACKYGVTVLNSPGTIDGDYRGELGVILVNHGREAFIVEPKMRIAQIVLAPVVRARYVQKQALCSTLRGEGGFGHTGTH